MQIFVNERAVASLAPNGATVGDVMEAMRAHFGPSEVVTAVDLDGQIFGADQESLYVGRAAESVERLSMTTATPEILAAALRDEIRAAFALMQVKRQRCSDLFLAGEERQASSCLAEMVEELHLILVLDRQVAVLDHNPDVLAIERFEGVALDLLHAQEEGRTQRLQEILATDLSDVLAGWQQQYAAMESSK